MVTVSLCMIVKNEEEVLARCLDSIKDFPDEIIIVDTGSTDKTKEIAAKYTSKIYDFEWVEDFSAARNFSFQQATSEYILWVDADDVILPAELTKLKALKQQNLTKDIYLIWYDYCQDEYGHSMSPLYRERLVKNSPHLRWEYPIHEIINLSNSIEETDITITHKKTSKGYSTDLNRNIKMLERAIASGKYPNDSRLRYYLAKECYDAFRYDKAATELQKFLDMNNGWWEDRTCAQQKLALTYLALSQQATDPQKKNEYRELSKDAALKATKADYRWAEPCYVLGTLALDVQDYQQAIYWYEQCRRPLPKVWAPTRPEYYTWLPNLQLCVCYNAVGNMKMAYERNQEALKYRPNDSRMTENERILHAALNTKKTPQQLVKLNMGSGNKRYQDYISCDKYPGKEVDEVFSLDNVPYADNTVEAIHSEHALEHLPHVGARSALREWFRVLRPGGEVHLQLPDLEECCRQYLNAKEKKYRDWYRWTLYGRQVTDGVIDEGQFHKTGFSLDELHQELQDIGFVMDFIGRYDGYDTPSLEVRALKPVDNTRIGWVYAGCALESPQYRIRVYHIDRWLRSRGYRSQIIGHERINDFDVLIFGRGFNESEYNQMIVAKQAGKTVILDLCEYLFGFSNEWYTRMISAANLVICCSHVLADKVREHNENVQVIEDAVESDFNLNCTYEVKDKPKVVFCGMGGHSHHAERLRPIIESEGFELVTIHEHDGATVKWGLSTWQQEVVKCDVGIAPCDYAVHLAKSNVKITSYMGFGLPTIAPPLDAYTRIIKNEQNGFIVKTDSEWRYALHQLKDAKVREKIGRAGKLTAFNYHLDRIAERWKNILVQKKIDVTVDIVIPTYKNIPYLKECLKSIGACTEHPHKVIVVNGGGKDETADFMAKEFPEVVLVNTERRLNFSEATNVGIKSGSSPYVCFLNDDTIVSVGWLTPLVEQIKGNVGLVNCLSNCDKGWLHNYEMKCGEVPLGPGTNILSSSGMITTKENASLSVTPEEIYHMRSPSSKVYIR